ncbi:hypothetical protein [Pseudomonas sp. SDO52101_S400]
MTSRKVGGYTLLGNGRLFLPDVELYRLVTTAAMTTVGRDCQF